MRDRPSPDLLRDTLADPSNRTLLQMDAPKSPDTLETFMIEIGLDACIDPFVRRGLGLAELPYLTFEVLSAIIPNAQQRNKFLMAIAGMAHADARSLLQRLRENDPSICSLGLINRGIGVNGVKVHLCSEMCCADVCTAAASGYTGDEHTPPNT